MVLELEHIVRNNCHLLCVFKPFKGYNIVNAAMVDRQVVVECRQLFWQVAPPPSLQPAVSMHSSACALPFLIFLKCCSPPMSSLYRHQHQVHPGLSDQLQRPQGLGHPLHGPRHELQRHRYSWVQSVL